MTPEGLKGILIGALIEALKKFLSAILAAALTVAAAILLSRLAKMAGAAMMISGLSYVVWLALR